jgi:hypothetical protein
MSGILIYKIYVILNNKLLLIPLIIKYLVLQKYLIVTFLFWNRRENSLREIIKGIH